MPKLDPFGSTDKLDNNMLDVMAKRLEVRGVHPSFQQALADYLDHLNIEAARAVLDLGCGTGLVAHTLLSHVDRPLAVLQEAARVTRPGGLIAIFDGDYASITFALEDPARTEAHDRKFIAGIVSSPYVMREMPRLLRQAGLELVQTFSYVMADIGKADFWLSAVEAFSKLLPKSGAMTEEEAKGWETSLKRASDEGVFFAASNCYTYIATAPA